MAREIETKEPPETLDAPAQGDGRIIRPVVERPEEPESKPPPLTPRDRAERRARLWRIGLPIALLVGAGLLWWRLTRPVPVEWVRPEMRRITETIAVAGRVAGRKQTVIGAQKAGVVARLFVDEGDVVTAGQPLALIQNDVARAQVRQAEQALRTARAQLEQAQAGARPTELRAAEAEVRRAEAAVRQAQAQLAQQRTAVRQAEAIVRQREAGRERALAAVSQSEARRELARQNLARYRQLLAEGAIARQTVDQAEAEDRTAEAELRAAREGVATAEADLAAARAALWAAREGVKSAEAAVSAARAAAAAADAERRTLVAGPRKEAVEVARQRVNDAKAALEVARDQAKDAVVRAPFPGTVTAILAEPGAPVAGTTGVVRLVQTGAPEIRADVDESNLKDLRVGLRAVITSTTFRAARLEGRIREIGAQVDVARGTVEVRVVPDRAPSWLKPGMTVDLNIIVAENLRRLVVPRSAVRREGDRSVVIVPRDGRAVARPVLLGPVEGEVVPVLEGLSAGDRIARDADRLEPGARVKE